MNVYEHGLEDLVRTFASQWEIDRLVHHAEIIGLNGDGYRLKDRDLGHVTPATTYD